METLRKYDRVMLISNGMRNYNFQYYSVYDNDSKGVGTLNPIKLYDVNGSSIPNTEIKSIWMGFYSLQKGEEIISSLISQIKIK